MKNDPEYSCGILPVGRNSEGRALNYWWGMSAGVIDLICSKNVPTGVKRLVDHLKSDIKREILCRFTEKSVHRTGHSKQEG